jgi:sodium-dependent phosphate transporter
LDDLPQRTIVAAILGTGAVAACVYMIFLYPYYRRKLVHNDWQLKWYDIVKGPIYYFKSTDNIPPIPEGHRLVIDYYAGRRYDEAGNLILEDGAPSTKSINSDDIEKSNEFNVEKVSVHSTTKQETTREKWLRMFKSGPKQWPRLIWLMVYHGFDQDVIVNQSQKKDILSGDIHGIHTSSKYYDNRLEYLYSILQAVTACTMSFAHGANDIANATGPLSTVYLVWTTNTVSSKADVPIWVLCYAAAALVIGVWMYGYNIMRNLGNKLILQSPSRGFSIELGAAVTTVMATQLKIPISTTQCAVGATVFVGFCNGEWRSVNWRVVLWCYAGWIITLPVAGLIAGLMNAIVLYAPSKGITYNMS